MEPATITKSPSKVWFPDFWRHHKAVVGFQEATARPDFSNWKDLKTDDASFKFNITAILILMLVLFIGRLLYKTSRKFVPCVKLCTKSCKTSQEKKDMNTCSNKFTLCLALGNNLKQVCMDIMDVPYQKTDYLFEAKTFIRDLSVTGTIKKSLTFKWDDLLILNKYVPLKIDIPQTIKITRKMATEVKDILASPHHVLIYIRDHKNKYEILPLQNTPWMQNIVSNPPYTSQTAPIYPTL